MADADIFFASPDTGTAGTSTHAQNIDNGGGTNVYLKGSFQGFFGTAGSMNQSAFSAYSGAMFGTCQYGNGATFTYTTPGGGYSLLYTPDGFNLTQSTLDAEINNIGAPLWTSAAATAAQQATNGLTINSNQISGPLNAGQIAGLPGTLLFTNATPLYSTRSAGTNGSGGGNNYYLYATVPPGRYYISAFMELDSAISGQGQYGGFYITNSQANLYGVNYRSSSDNNNAQSLRMGLSSANGYAPPQIICWSQSGGGTYVFANGEGILTCTVTNYIWAQIQTYFAGWTNQPWLNTNSFIYLRAF